ncbi:hypothetical protein ACFPT3_17080 [Ectobacillus antri]
MRIRGLGAKTAENIYHHIMQRVQYEKQWEVLDASLLSYYNWFVEYITDEPGVLINQGIGFMSPFLFGCKFMLVNLLIYI